MIALLLFDIDGTLLLTGGAGQRAMTRAFDEVLGSSRGLDGVALAGRTDRAILDEALAIVRPSLASDDPSLGLLHDRYLSLLETELATPNAAKRVLPGVHELLSALDGRDDVELALLTGNFVEAAEIKLQHFDLWRFFGWGAFGDLDPDRNRLMHHALAEAARRGVGRASGGHVVVIGDTPHDVSCARAGEARAVAVATGGFGRDALVATGADVVLDDLSDTPAVLRALGLQG